MEHIKSKSLSSLIFILLACFIFIRPFFSGLAYPVFEFYYETAVISLAIIILFLSLREVYLKRSQDVRAKNNYAIPIILLSLAYIFSTAVSINIQNSLKETIKFISYISVFFIVSQADGNQKKILIKIIVICASMISIYCIYQYIWGYQHTLDYLKKINSDFVSTSIYAEDILLIDKRSIGTFPSPNILGGYLIIIFPLSLMLLKNTSSYSQKWVLLPILMVISLILTKSIGPILIFIATFIILLFSSDNTFKNKKLIFVIFIIFLSFALAFIIYNRWNRLVVFKSGHNPLTMRLNYWRTTMAIIKEHPFLGIGPGNFQEVFLKYYKLGWGTGTRYAHNIFLQIWSETGVLGLLSIIYLFMAFIRNTLNSKYLFLAGLAFVLHNLIDITYFMPEVGLFWWIIIGLACHEPELKRY